MGKGQGFRGDYESDLCMYFNVCWFCTGRGCVMCIIAICENRALSYPEFETCFNGNRHGAGFAWWDGEKVSMKKGYMEIKGAWKAYATVPVPHIAHFRISSSGSVCKELTQPFLCTPESPLVQKWEGDGKLLFHNGTVRDWKQALLSAILATKVKPDGKMNDSRAGAIMASFIDDTIFDFWTGDRWLLLDKDGYRKYGTWVEGDDGILYSNSGWKRITYTGGRQASYISGWNTRMQTEMGYGGSWANRSYGGKSCINCKHYLLGMECSKLGKLKDTFACPNYEFDSLPDKPDPYNFSRPTTCEDCENFMGGMECKIRGEMKDYIRCRLDFVPRLDDEPIVQAFKCEHCRFFSEPLTCHKRGKMYNNRICALFEESIPDTKEDRFDEEAQDLVVYVDPNEV